MNAHPTNVTYRIDDGTGVMDVKKWMDPDQAAAQEHDPRLVPDKYVRVFGRLRTMNNKKHIGAQWLRPVDDYNEVSYHLLEAAYVHLYLTKGPLDGAAAAAAATTTDVKNEYGDGAAGGGGDPMFVDEGANVRQKLDGGSRLAQTMFDALRNAPGADNGVNLHDLCKQTHLSARDILEAAEELVAMGIIYTTENDETWTILET